MKMPKTVPLLLPVLKKNGVLLYMSSRQFFSNVNAFSTIIEKLTEKKLFLLSTDFFHGSQYGFLKGRSNSHAIWFWANKLQISAPKSQHMLFIPQQSRYIPDFSLAFNLNEDGENDLSKVVPEK